MICFCCVQSTSAEHKRAVKRCETSVLSSSMPELVAQSSVSSPRSKCPARCLAPSLTSAKPWKHKTTTLPRSRWRRQSQKGPSRLSELQAAFRAVAASAFGVWASWAGRWVVSLNSGLLWLAHKYISLVKQGFKKML